MAEIWLILGPLIAIFLGVKIYFWVGDIQYKNDQKKMEKHFNNEGKKDIESFESFMKANNISLPNRKNTDTALIYVQSLIDHTLEHFQNVLKENLKKAGYTNNFELKKVGTIFYNSNYVLIYKDAFLRIRPSGFSYYYIDVEGDRHYWSLSEIFDYCKKIEKPDAYKVLAEEIALKDFYWYVEYPDSGGSKLIDMGVDAVVGGVLFGGLGALGGASLSADKQKKKAEEEVEVFLVKKSLRYSIAKGYPYAKSAIENLNKHLPNNRLRNSYKNHL